MNTLERKNFQANALGAYESLAARNARSSCILSTHEQLLSRIDRYQCDPGFRTEMRERYRRLMRRVDGTVPSGPVPTRRLPTPPVKAGLMKNPSEENAAGPIYRSAETQTGPELERVTMIRRPSSAKTLRPASAAGSLPTRPRTSTPQSRMPPRRLSAGHSSTPTLRTLEQALQD